MTTNSKRLPIINVRSKYYTPVGNGLIFAVFGITTLLLGVLTH